MSQPPRSKPPVRQVPPRNARPAASPPPPSRGAAPRRPEYRNAPPQRDPFPYIMGGIIGALVVGLMLVIFLLINNNNNNNPSIAGNPSTNPNTNTGGNPSAGTAVPTEQPAPRMSMEDFKRLYDNPATRPIIIDVRAKQAYDEGHIAGAISFPEADVDARVAELPKDKLIVAYCQ
jgi:hypothetical protein